MDLLKYIIAQTNWLDFILFQNNWFFFDLWSIVHIWGGIVIFLLLKSQSVKRPFLILFILLTLYEIFEILILYFPFHFFLPETFQDKLSDIITGMLGGILAYYFLRFAINYGTKSRKLLLVSITLMASFTYAFPWVGFYKYHYNIAFFNTPGINLFSLICWITGGYCTIYVFRTLKYKSPLGRLLITWISYIIILFGVEFIGYSLFGVHENSNSGATPLLFGLIHGNTVLHIFYLISPLCTISLYSSFHWLLFKCIELESPESTVAKEPNVIYD